jgi:hypothetical protein
MSLSSSQIAERITGMRLSEAQEFADIFGKKIRIAMVNNVDQISSDETFDPDRVNVSLINKAIIHAWCG